MPGQGFVPEVLFEGNYYPICGRYFWDNNIGAQTVCQALGFGDGYDIRTDNTYDVDAMPVGACNSGEPLNDCTGGGNAFGDFEYNDGWCKQGNEIGVEVVCTGE